jgi:formate hydrogenlyase subunit 3/multisubunit Na+/H+ antiporter MnhD subunit
MTLFLCALGILVLSGLVRRVGPFGAVIGCVLGLVAPIDALVSQVPVSLRRPWSVPYGEFHVEIDGLSAFFLVPIFLISGLAALYGSEYLARPKRWTWFFYNVLVASMAVVVVARNSVLFLVAWEVMALASFFLVTYEDDKEHVRAAGWTYLVATHLGTAFLLVMFILEEGNAPNPNLVFLLALVGFGTKAGFMPLHVWLPEAHPAAPSHVSAVMSGVMIKTGIYGLMRVLLKLGSPPAWWGWVLIGIGATSGVLGVLFALAQHDLKRLLAYHSVENIGIIALGLGVGLLGVTYGEPTLQAVGFGGALLHVLNHALFKGLLFLGAGAVLHATGTREMDHLGGLGKRMPWTAAAFLVGAVAISGLPPLNGFVSEFLIYFGAYRGTTTGVGPAGVLVIGSLALIGGLATACFTKVFGVVFLGEPRSHHHEAHEVGWAMRMPMVLLAVLCLAIGLGAPWLLEFLPVRRDVDAAAGPLLVVTLAGLVFGSLVLFLVALRRGLLSKRTVAQTVTWDCGYAHPSARMQYTSSSFAQPLTDLFGSALQTEKKLETPEGYFPSTATFATETPDVFREKLFRPVFDRVGWFSLKLRWFQHGRVQLYILYIVLTLLLLLAWKLE